jgi:transcriptional regulator with XRE-family HTH domain
MKMTEKPITIINDIIAQAAKRGIAQKELARRANCSETALSRLKRNGNPTYALLERLATACGLRVGVLEAGRMPRPRSTTFRDRHPDLVWSDSKAPDRTLLVKALLHPQFTTLLDAAVTFGFDMVRDTWQSLLEESSPEVLRARERTERILRNIEHGYHQATA